MKRWLHMGPDWSTPFAATDPREGGDYAVEMRNPSGGRLRYEGSYLQVDRPRRLEMTWPAYAREELQSVLEVALDGLEDGGTQVTVTHRGLPDRAARRDHRTGWDAVLERLEAALAGDGRYVG